MLLEVVNNSGLPLRVEQQPNELKQINPGSTTPIAFPDNPEGDLIVTVANCRYSYPIVDAIRRYHWGGLQNTLSLQMEPDFSLYLLPREVRAPATTEVLGRLRSSGMAVRPRQSTCVVKQNAD